MGIENSYKIFILDFQYHIHTSVTKINTLPTHYLFKPIKRIFFSYIPEASNTKWNKRIRRKNGLICLAITAATDDGIRRYQHQSHFCKNYNAVWYVTCRTLVGLSSLSSGHKHLSKRNRGRTVKMYYSKTSIGITFGLRKSVPYI